MDTVYKSNPSNLKFTSPAGDEYLLPKNLDILKGDEEADKFTELIQPWNENKGAENIENSCEYWKARNNVTEEPNSNRAKRSRELEILDETQLPTRKRGPKIMQRIING